MIKNVALKKFLKKAVFPILTGINKIIPKNDNIVLLYSANKGIIFCNITLRKYLLDNGYDKKYKIYCGIEKMKYAEDIPQVTFVSGIKAIKVFLKAGHVFYTAGQLPIKPSKKQCVIHMMHGNADFKKMGQSTNINNGDEFFFTYLIAPSDLYIPSYVEAYRCKPSNIAIAGDPMCDDLLTRPRNIYDFSSYSKLLVWLPTFRQSDDMGYNDSHLETLIPLFSENDYEKLDKLLGKYNIKLIVKLHPVQTAPEGTQRHFKYLSVFSHKEFLQSEYDMYTLVAHSDGLIGDYSSASMQYLLLDRPMAFVVPDLDDYRATRGFVFNNPEDYMGGHIVKTKEQFAKFIEDFARNLDIYRDKRHWVCNQVYKYKDANSCKRIVELSGMSV